MKKSICVILAVTLLAGSFLLCETASANSWGLKGKLLTVVMADHTWDDYTTLSNQEGSFAVMQSRYHNALFLWTAKSTFMSIQRQSISRKQKKSTEAVLGRTLSDDFIWRV